MKVAIYLRKSRADEELEKTIGEGETLSKHRKALLKFAKDKKLNITEIKEEIVSGDSLFHRPKMLELLKEVEACMYDGVLVMDIDRLGRGGMKDQGIILDAFKESKTKIITPLKTYDLNDEFDEEMTEFKTFFSRRELKTINRRMQGGRVRSIEEGNYLSSIPPYGYDIHYINKCRVLKPNPIESEIVKMMFKLYIDGNGATAIANHFNSLGYKTRNKINFKSSTILNILKNPVHTGKVTWKKKDIRKSKDPNKVKDTKTRDVSEWIIADGKHEAIIDDITWNKTQEILKNKYHVPYQLTNGPANPLAGVIVCSECKSKMVMRNLRGISRILCTNNNCNNISHKFDDVEKYILDGLENYLKSYKIDMSSNNKAPNLKPYEQQLNALNKELAILNDQKLKLFDFLERGIYSENVFLDRSNNLDERINSTIQSIKETKKVIENKTNITTKNEIVKFEKLLDGYKKTNNIQKKNSLIKAILFKAEYTKNKKGNDFHIELFPKINS